MIDTVLNLLFRCPHRRLTRPVTPVSKGGVPQGETYVVCLDCGKQFAYDMQAMRVGKPLDSSHPTGVLLPEPAKLGNRKLKWAALWASIPLAVLIGSHLSKQKSTPAEPENK
jgi:hypothetical protein